MAESGVHNWAGRSGMEYEYWVCPLDARFADKPGVFVYAARDGDSWRPLYIAAAANLREELRSHAGASKALEMGASHVHVRVSEDAGEDREREVRDLVSYWQPALNLEAGAGAQAADRQHVTAVETHLTVSPNAEPEPARTAAPQQSKSQETGRQPPAGNEEAKEPVIVSMDTVLTVSPGTASEQAGGEQAGGEQAGGAVSSSERAFVGSVVEVSGPIPEKPAPKEQDAPRGEPPSLEWEGASDQLYKYWIFPLDHQFSAEPGNYIYARADEESNSWEALYVGETSNLRDEIRGHRGAVLALRSGATHLHVHQSADYELGRRFEQDDLVRAYNPSCQN